MPHTPPPRVSLTRMTLEPAAPWDDDPATQRLSAFLIVDHGRVRRLLHLPDVLSALPALRVGRLCPVVGAHLRVHHDSSGLVLLEARYAVDEQEAILGVPLPAWNRILRNLAQQAADKLLEVGRHDLAEPLVPVLLHENPPDTQTLL